MHHKAQLRSKDKKKMTALGGILAESMKAGHMSSVHMICSNTALATLA